MYTRIVDVNVGHRSIPKFSSRSSFAEDHLAVSPLPSLHLPSLTVTNPTLRPLLFTLSTPPASIQRPRFLHWLTSKRSKSLHPSTTASTPVPVTRTQPRTERLRNSRRCSDMLRSDPSETAEPQKARLRCVREGRPRARTSVAVSERAQQNDYHNTN
jgi:hypothetical protein